MSMLVASLVVMVSVVLGLPSGAPPDACSNLVPHHGSHQASPYASPYTVSASSDTYTAGKSITVIIKAPSGKKFKGFLIQAQDSNTGTPIKYGSWSGRSAKELHCAAVTHTSASDKSKVELTWTPTYGDGDVTFIATIVENFSTFYTDIKARVYGSSSGSASSSSSLAYDSDSDRNGNSEAYEDSDSGSKTTSYPYSNRRPSYNRPSSNSASHSSYPGSSKHSSNQQDEEYVGNVYDDQRHHHSPSSFRGSSSGSSGFATDPYAAYRAYQQAHSSSHFAGSPSDSSNSDQGEDKQESVDTFYSAYPQASSSLYSQPQLHYSQFPRYYPQFH